MPIVLNAKDHIIFDRTECGAIRSTINLKSKDITPQNILDFCEALETVKETLEKHLEKHVQELAGQKGLDL